MTAPNISATDAARAALARLRSEFGEIILHVTGGWCARTPLVLHKSDLKLGPRDLLIGTVDGVPVYKMQTAPEEHLAAPLAYVLEIVDGQTIGFSIEPAPGKHFMLSGA